MKLYYDMMYNSDCSKQWIRVFYINIGRRPTCVKSIGYYDWTLGSYLSRGGDDYEQKLEEGDFGHYDIEISDSEKWKIKTIFISDYFGNTWTIPKKRMIFLYESAHKQNKLGPKIGEKFKAQQKKSMDEYLKFLIKNGYTNTDPLLKKYKETGEIYE